MGKKVRASIPNLNATWTRLMKYVENNPVDIKYVAKTFNDMLDELRSNDFFGTEAQCDPRGDGRED